MVIRYLEREMQENQEVCKINLKIACEGFEPLGIDKALSADNIRPRVQREVGVGWRKVQHIFFSKVARLSTLGADQVNTDESKAPAAAKIVR